MAGRIPLIAIVGRTNVGKSTLFNRLVGRRLAIVEDSPGVTRDRSYAYVDRFERAFTLIDTGGLAGEENCPYTSLVRQQAELAIAEADLIIALFDGLNGLHPQDAEVTAVLRKSGKPVLWTINKCEKEFTDLQAAEFYALGLEEFTLISALHNVGVADFSEQLIQLLPESTITEAGDSAAPIKIAILGKPNTGKSTLINTLLGESRLVTSPEAGTTRDSIMVPLQDRNQSYLLVDTAGLRKKRKVTDSTVERFSNLRTLKALAECDIAVLLLDGTQGLPGEQDVKIASLIHERGRGFLIAVNKWDALEHDHRSARGFQEGIRRILHFAPYAPITFVSALTGKRCRGLLSKAGEIYASARQHIATSDLNRVLTQAFFRHHPPTHRGHEVKLFFATQIDQAPPTFLLFVNYPAGVTAVYQRYLLNALQETYKFNGTTIKLLLRRRSTKEERQDGGAAQSRSKQSKR